MQSFRPQFTAQSIFDIKDQGALAIVREIGFGKLGLASLIRPEWVVPAAIVGGLYYGLAGLAISSARTGTSKSGRRSFLTSRSSSCSPSAL
jgi:hypothetical protein